MMIVCCSTPSPKPTEDTSKFRIPKRLQRVRRVFESKRMDSFKNLHENLVKTANDEKEFLKSIFDSQKLSDAFEVDEE